MVPLNFTNLGFRIQLDKLRVLIRRQNMKILIPDENIQILIRLTDRRMLRRIQERRQVSPEFFSRGIGILHAIKSTGKAILLGKLAEILTERRRILIIEITTAGSGKSRSTPTITQSAVLIFSIKAAICSLYGAQGLSLNS